MKGTILKILFIENMAFLTREVALDFTQVDLPAGTVRFKSPAFWTIRVINYKEAQKELFAEVLDYQIGETEFSYEQLQLNDQLIGIDKVKFKSIDTFGWLNSMKGTKSGKFMPAKPETVFRKEIAGRTPVKVIHSDPFSIPFKDVSFLSGKVTFEKKIQSLGKLVKFEILNENIIEQYDAIKNYFGNVLKTKKIQVIPTVIIIDGEIESISARSEEINKINNTVIEDVKFDLVKGAGKKEVSGQGQLFTKDEYLTAFVDEDIRELFNDDNDFFETIVEKSATKHYNHLRFLASKHRHDLQKLRIVHKPFSFVFLLSGTDNFHVVWETLDTEEATYMWRFKKDAMSTDQMLAEANLAINIILREGRNEYRLRMESNFERVLHDYKDPQNGFRSWKVELEKIISKEP